jgi:nitrogen fixation protein NifB
MNSVQMGATAQASSLKDHPCFNQEARHTHARIHLPVAPRCNMQCNYCNRKYSCVNESRPGVTCAVLSPGQAIEYLRGYTTKLKNLSVVGIAGPGDPMACASETLETLRMVKAEFPHLLLCLASNGLNLLPYVDDLPSLGLSHVTVTVNAVEPKIGAEFYDWMVVDGRRHTGIDAAEVLWDRQQRSIQSLVKAGVIVKVNTIYVPGMNDEHIEQVAQTVSVLGATILNIMPLLPTAGTPFAAVPEPDRDQLKNLRAVAVRYLPQMTHCSRCRADAVGMLGEENSRKNMELLQIASRVVIGDVPISPSAAIDSECDLPMTISPRLRLAATAERPYIAVASKDGMMVNQHLGAATTFRIYRPDAQSSQLVDLRKVASEASGPTRWMNMIEILKDCSGILVSGAGAMPRKIFAHHGITVGIVEGLIDEALDATAKGDDLMFMAKTDFHCGPSCSGDKDGC